MSSPRNAAQDFDFEIGLWRVRHRRLKKRLAACDDWEEFDGTADVRPVLGGQGNVEDNVIHFPAGTYRAIAVRAFDPIAGTWAIWWLSSDDPHRLDTPVIGHFADGTGAFYADETLLGRPVKVRFLWLQTDTATPRWEQAMSADAGKTWETNWTMDFERCDPAVKHIVAG